MDIEPEPAIELGVNFSPILEIDPYVITVRVAFQEKDSR
jgi:hypothetical protein